MSMLQRVVSTYCKDTILLDENDTQHLVRFDNFLEAMTRPYAMDRQAAVTADSEIAAGMILTSPSGATYTAFNMEEDYYRGKLLRKRFGLAANNNLVTVRRATPAKSAQGGVMGKTNTALYTAVPCKVMTGAQRDDKNADEKLPQNLLLLSCDYPVQIGDELLFEAGYAPAKVEGIKLNYRGLQEIAFDKEPRWQSQLP